MHKLKLRFVLGWQLVSLHIVLFTSQNLKLKIVKVVYEIFCKELSVIYKLRIDIAI
jgi:hypothetical protein